MLLKEIVDEGLFAFYEDADSWQDAIQKSCEPLVRRGYVTQEYAQRIIACVDEFGPYIVIVPGLAIPHATKAVAGTTKTAIAFAKFKNRISFDEEDPEKYATVFFALAAVDEEEHLKNMRQLFQVLSDDQLLEKLGQVECAEQLLELDGLLE